MNYNNTAVVKSKSRDFLLFFPDTDDEVQPLPKLKCDVSASPYDSDVLELRRGQKRFGRLTANLYRHMNLNPAGRAIGED